MLQDGPHHHCAKKVSSAFEKVCFFLIESFKNEIKLSVFMNTILINSKSPLTESRSSRAKSAGTISRKMNRYDEKKEEKSTAARSSSKGCFESVRDVAAMRSLSKYLTPKVKIKTYNSFLIVD